MIFLKFILQQLPCTKVSDMSLLATHVHFRIPKYDKVKRKLIMHFDVTLFAIKSSRRKNLKLEERK